MSKRLSLDPDSEPTPTADPVPAPAPTSGVSPSDSSWADQPSSAPGTPVEGPEDVVVAPAPPELTTYPFRRTNDPDFIEVLLELEVGTVTAQVIPASNVMGPKVWYENHYYVHADADDDPNGQAIYRTEQVTPSTPPPPPPPKPSEASAHNPKAAANARKTG